MSDIQAYQLYPGGTPARMRILLNEAAASVRNRNEATRLQPNDWRGARHYTMKRYQDAFCSGLHQGFNGTNPVYYSHGGQYFRNERYCDDVHARIDHKGWFTDTDCSEKARGIIASLTHGRFIAGYELSDSGERVYFTELYSCEIDAARMADEHARIVADSEREHAEKFYAAQKLETKIEDSLQRLRECLDLRNNPCFSTLRAEALRLLETIRETRETLEIDFAGVL